MCDVVGRHKETDSYTCATRLQTWEPRVPVFDSCVICCSCPSFREAILGMVETLEGFLAAEKKDSRIHVYYKDFRVGKDFDYECSAVIQCERTLLCGGI